MNNIKVYTHYFNKNDKEYRWRTILQIGNSWEVCGTIFMKNPGSSINLKEKPLPIDDKSLLEHLRQFDDTESLLYCEWYEFSIDKTMSCVIKLFEAYYHYHHKKFEGVIQIFNLFNIRDANLGKAIDKSKGDVIENLASTTDYDIKHIVSPVYIGWGNLWKNKIHRINAEKIFAEVIARTPYLCNDIQNNKFFHPQYLMNYGKNKVNCKNDLENFINGIKKNNLQTK